MSAKPVDKLLQKFMKTLSNRRIPANIIAMEVHDYNFQKKNFGMKKVIDKE